MSQAARFWQYAEEATLSARQSKSEMEKAGLMDLLAHGVAANSLSVVATGRPRQTIKSAVCRRRAATDPAAADLPEDHWAMAVRDRGRARGFSTGGLDGSASCQRWGMLRPLSIGSLGMMGKARQDY